MDHYVEIRVLPDPEFNTTTLMNALFAKFHRALVADGHCDVGVSFPQAGKTLGDTLRLNGGIVSLQRLMGINWLTGLKDYTTVSEVLPVPKGCKYRVVKRVQAKSNTERLYRRSVKKGWISEAEAEKKSTKKEQRLKHPFVSLRSNSSGQQFRLFIHQGQIMDSPQMGTFSAYGLSANATIPWF
jgi:CRISPR-associated endonuclease Csy4